MIDRSGDYIDTLSGGVGADILDCWDNPLPITDPGSRPDTVTGDGDTDIFWIDDVDNDDAVWPIETPTVQSSGLNLDTTYKPAES